ncbi:MAG: Hsp20/alpha crystallin family protein [Pseudomonadota bacterium]|nr:Hsp20/alpha crystallin family protein [Pseudomonadota bacterium]
MHDGVLSIEARRKSEQQEKECEQIQSERRYGKFIRHFALSGKPTNRLCRPNLKKVC